MWQTVADGTDEGNKNSSFGVSNAKSACAVCSQASKDVLFHPRYMRQ